MTPVNPRPPRNLALDALRALAIVGMMAAHTTRLIDFDARQGWSTSVILLEPLIPSLFLLMVGVSLAFSFSAASARGALDEGPRAPRLRGGDWYGRQLKRAAGLWGIALLFYVLELGPRFPDFVTASGVLATISYAIVLTGALLIVPVRGWALGAAFVLSTAVLIAIDRSGQPVFPLTSGNAPFLPLWSFAFAGALWGLLYKHSPHATFWIGVFGIFVAWMIAHRFGVEALFTKPFGRSDAARELAAPLFLENVFGGEKRLGYYNLRPVLALFCLGVHLALLGVLGRVLALLRGRAARTASSVFVLGRHSLGAYVLHLALLACLVTAFGIRPLKTTSQGNAVLIGVLAITVIWALWRDGRENRERRREAA